MLPQRLLVALLGVLLVGACAITPRDIYKDMHEAMEAEVEPLVEKLLPTELNRDAERMDWLSIRSASTRVRSLFRQARNKERSVYISSESKRKHARTAEAWFASIAAAATHEQRDTLIELYKQKATICGNCHRKW